jgi:hypothetical protein
MAIDVHAHYVPQSLIAAARERGALMGVQVIDAMDPGRTPPWVFPAHPLDQIT